jgi:hypothetical protein
MSAAESGKRADRMPRRIAVGEADGIGGGELTRGDVAWIEWQREIWKITHPRTPVPDFAQECRERNARPPANPVDWSTTEGKARLEWVREQDEKLRKEPYREEETE